jgi:hypothetical protein
MCEKFSEHPNKVGESYAKHLVYAWKKSFCFLKISIVCFIHGLFPFIWETRASDRVKEVSEEMENRKDGTCE